MSATVLNAEIRSGDVLNVVIKGVPAQEKVLVDGQYIVGKDGRIKIPLADVMLGARGLDHDQLSRAIEGVFKEKGIYSRPTITVQGAEQKATGQAQLSVGGRVRRPGPIAFRPRLTLLQAIQAAGDIDTFGTKKRIFLSRNGKAQVFDLRKAAHQNFVLKSEDTIVVDRKGVFDKE